MDTLYFLMATAIILLALTIGEPHHQRSQPRTLPVPVPSRTQRQVATLDAHESRDRS